MGPVRLGKPQSSGNLSRYFGPTPNKGSGTATHNEGQDVGAK